MRTHTRHNTAAMNGSEAMDLATTRWAHELLMGADPGMTVERALVAQQKRCDGGPKSIGYESGGRILCKLAGIGSRTKVLDMRCDELCERIKTRGLWQAVEAAKAGTVLEEPFRDDLDGGGDPYEVHFPTARRAGAEEAREIGTRTMDDTHASQGRSLA